MLNAAAVVTTNSRALWYLTRGFGLMAMVLLTLVMVLGLTQAVRYARPGLPRFVVSALHKNASLVAVLLIAVHVITAVADSYAPIRVIDVLIPFVSKYRPVWTGLGALSLDLLIALVVTSLLRERLGLRTWRVVHWTAYACWPVALVHGLGTGSDTKLGWVQAIYVVCTLSVVGSLWWRLARGWNEWRMTAVLASVGVPVAVLAWTLIGPLHPGWARRAGTPAALLGSAAAASAGGTARGGAKAGGAQAANLAVPFEARFEGVQSQSGPDSNGLTSLTFRGRFVGSRQSGYLTIVLTGQPVSGGGVELTGSQVNLGPDGAPSMYQGHVSQLQGNTLQAMLTDSSGGTLTVTIQLNVQQGSSQVGGTIEAGQ